MSDPLNPFIKGTPEFEYWNQAREISGKHTLPSYLEFREKAFADAFSQEGGNWTPEGKLKLYPEFWNDPKKQTEYLKKENVVKQAHETERNLRLQNQFREKVTAQLSEDIKGLDALDKARVSGGFDLRKLSAEEQGPARGLMSRIASSGGGRSLDELLPGEGPLRDRLKNQILEHQAKIESTRLRGPVARAKLGTMENPIVTEATEIKATGLGKSKISPGAAGFFYGMVAEPMIKSAMEGSKGGPELVKELEANEDPMITKAREEARKQYELKKQKERQQNEKDIRKVLEDSRRRQY